jgi:hypothetical protein
MDTLPSYALNNQENQDDISSHYNLSITERAFAAVIGGCSFSSTRALAKHLNSLSSGNFQIRLSVKPRTANVEFDLACLHAIVSSQRTSSIVRFVRP